MVYTYIFLNFIQYSKFHNHFVPLLYHDTKKSYKKYINFLSRTLQSLYQKEKYISLCAYLRHMYITGPVSVNKHFDILLKGSRRVSGPPWPFPSSNIKDHRIWLRLLLTFRDIFFFWRDFFQVYALSNMQEYVAVRLL